jgi:hypothetical protein
LAQHRRDFTEIEDHVRRLRRRLIPDALRFSARGDVHAHRHHDTCFDESGDHLSVHSSNFAIDIFRGVTASERVESLTRRMSEIVVHGRAMSYANHHDKKNLVASRFMSACDRRNLIEPCVNTYEGKCVNNAELFPTCA